MKDKNRNKQIGTKVDGKGKPDKNAHVNNEAFISDKKKKRGTLKDTTIDSIINRPKTETYEENTE
jgi:glucose/arabinose dehydrogenase